MEMARQCISGRLPVRGMDIFFFHLFLFDDDEFDVASVSISGGTSGV